jgi:predicted TIM-barrel fold metal-dependent hydrolase
VAVVIDRRVVHRRGVFCANTEATPRLFFADAGIVEWRHSCGELTAGPRPMYDPLYEAAVRLDVPLAVHGGSSAGLGLDLYDSFVKILVVEHAVAQQIHFTSYLLDGGPVRFPGLKIAFLEAGVGWVPYLIERLDENSKSSRSRLLCYPMSRAIMSGPVQFISPASSKKKSCPT